MVYGRPEERPKTSLHRHVSFMPMPTSTTGGMGSKSRLIEVLGDRAPFDGLALRRALHPLGGAARSYDGVLLGSPMVEAIHSILGHECVILRPESSRHLRTICRATLLMETPQLVSDGEKLCDENWWSPSSQRYRDAHVARLQSRPRRGIEICDAVRLRFG
jgi:hypothetical protein